MKKNDFGTLIFLSIVFLSSCLSTEKKNAEIDKIASNVLEEVIHSAAESIIEKLPENATVALFNNSNEQMNLTNFVIEEISSVLIKKGGLRIVEREKFKSIESEHKFQMETGYISDDQIASITEKLGAEYTVSCYISGDGALQRLRIKAWNVSTGQTMMSSPYPTNDLGVELTNVKGSGFQTIRENGITLDFDIEYNTKEKSTLAAEIYIDGTRFYSLISYDYEVFNDSWTESLLITHSDGRPEHWMSNIPGKDEVGVIDRFVAIVLSILENEGDIDKRTINTLSHSFKKAIQDSLNSQQKA
jgi:hypothetical protein